MRFHMLVRPVTYRILSSKHKKMGKKCNKKKQFKFFDGIHRICRTASYVTQYEMVYFIYFMGVGDRLIEGYRKRVCSLTRFLHAQSFMCAWGSYSHTAHFFIITKYHSAGRWHRASPHSSIPHYSPEFQNPIGTWGLHKKPHSSFPGKPLFFPIPIVA